MKGDNGYLERLERKLDRMRAPSRQLSAKEIIAQLELSRQCSPAAAAASTAGDRSCGGLEELDEATAERKQHPARRPDDTSELVVLVTDDWLDKVHSAAMAAAMAASTYSERAVPAALPAGCLSRAPPAGE